MTNTEQLRTLSIFHYVVGALHALFGCLGLIHFGLGVLMLVSPESMQTDGSPIPAFAAWMFILLGGGFVLFGVGLGVLTALSGRFISRRVHRTYSIIVGGINCVMFPFGTALGIFDLLVLTREDVAREYAPSSIGAPQSPDEYPPR